MIGSKGITMQTSSDRVETMTTEVAIAMVIGDQEDNNNSSRNSTIPMRDEKKIGELA